MKTKKTSNTQRLLSILLTLFMVMSLLPLAILPVLAESDVLYSITLSNDGNGTAESFSGATGYDRATEAWAGDTIMLDAYPEGDYVFDQWIVVEGLSEGAISDVFDPQATFTMPSNPVSLRATFKLPARNQWLRVSSAGNGTVSATVNGRTNVDADVVTVVYRGDTIVLSAVPDFGYRFVRWDDLKDGDDPTLHADGFDEFNANAS